MKFLWKQDDNEMAYTNDLAIIILVQFCLKFWFIIIVNPAQSKISLKNLNWLLDINMSKKDS